MTRGLVLAAALVAAAGTARAEPRTLRMAAVAPEGTAWARELRAYARELETSTHGELKMKWYLGGIAGDELQALERVRKGQLDGAAGVAFCQSLGASMRVLRAPGLFRSREEALFVLGRLKQNLDAEFHQNGFAFMGWASFGFDAIFSRTPIRTIAELKKAKLWVWNLDPVWGPMGAAMGLDLHPTPVSDAAAAFDAQHLDGFIAAPTAALAFQWTTQTHYFTPLDAAFLPGCAALSLNTFESLSIEQREIVRSAAAKFLNRFTDLNGVTDRALLGGLLEKQGLKRVEVSESLRAEFQAAAREGRAKLGAGVVPKELVDKVIGWLSEYRSERHTEVVR
jgi:TRAP-type C4-dicarboxylate transport system substrate-binding protein